MEFCHDSLISLQEPKSEGNARYWLLVGLLAICFLFAGPDVKRPTDDSRRDTEVTSWLSMKKARQLMRYHGTNGIMVTAAEVFIKRDGRWICVYRDPSSPPKKGDRSHTPVPAGRIDKEES